MTRIFTTVVEMSVTSTVVILVVLVLRALLSRAPKKYSYVLWAAAAFRLLCPVSVSSVFSLFNLTVTRVKEQTVNQTTGETVTQVLPTVPGGTIAVTPQSSTPVTEPTVTAINWDEVLSVIWIIGVVVVLLVICAQVLKLRHKTRFAVRVEGNVWESDEIPGPFVLGLFKPRVFLPVWLKGAQRDHVLAHERYHIGRMDHWVKALCQIILAIHWFNPFVWLMMWAVDRDMELSCDEGALKALGQETREDYSRTLLSLAANRRDFGPVLAFGTPAVKKRIVNALRYHKAAKITVVLAVAVLLIAALTCCTNAKQDGQNESYADELYQAKVEYVGDNSAVVKLIGVMTQEYQLDFDSVELHTGEEPYGITLNMFVPEGWDYQLEDHFDVDEKAFSMSVLLLALIDNLDYCQQSYDLLAEEERVDYAQIFPRMTVAQAEEFLGIDDLKHYAESPESINELLTLIGKVDVQQAKYSLAVASDELTDDAEGVPNYVLYDMLDPQLDDVTIFAPQIALFENGESCIYRVDNDAIGHYTEENGILTLKDEMNDRIYLFRRIDSTTIEFVADGSDEVVMVVENDYLSAPIVDGTRFVIHSADVDAQQIINSCFVYDGASDVALQIFNDGDFLLNYNEGAVRYAYNGEWIRHGDQLELDFNGSEARMCFKIVSGSELSLQRDRSDLTGLEVDGAMTWGGCFLLDSKLEPGTVQIGVAVIDTQVEYYQLVVDMQSTGLFLPTLRLLSDGTYVFNFSWLSSRFHAGEWQEKDGVLTLTENDGGTFVFRRLDDNTLEFVEDASSDYEQFPQHEVGFGDGDLFRREPGTVHYSWPGVTLVKDGNRYEIQGLDADHISVYPSQRGTAGDIYFANPAFLGEYFDGKYIEGHAGWTDTGETSISVGFTQSAGVSDGTLTGPSLNFELDLVTGELSHITFVTYEVNGEKVTLSGHEMKEVGYMLASLLQMVEHSAAQEG